MVTTAFELLDFATSMFNPNDETASQIIERLLPKLSYTDVSKAIIARDKYLHDTTLTDEKKEWLFTQFDPVSALFMEFDLNKYKSIHALLSRTNKRSGKSWWYYISDYLKKPEKLLKVLSQNDPKIANLLSTKEGLEYVQYLCNRDYDFFYHWTWFFPRAHRGCGGRIKYGRVRKTHMSVWAFYCARCGTIFTDDVLENDYANEVYTYKIKKKKKPQPKA